MRTWGHRQLAMWVLLAVTVSACAPTGDPAAPSTVAADGPPALAVPPGSTVACVTHSVILESVCAAAFHSDFESVHTQTLAWMRCRYSPPAGGLVLEEARGVEFAPSPDALALDEATIAGIHRSTAFDSRW